MKKACIPLLLLALAITSHAADPLKTLTTIPVFAFGGIGVTGATSEGELAFREILKRPSAEKDFLALLKSGNAQGKCYALVGLHGINPKDYPFHAAPYVKSAAIVHMIGGCMPADLPMYSIVGNIGAGEYDEYSKK